jgi:hypothetical protein
MAAKQLQHRRAQRETGMIVGKADDIPIRDKLFVTGQCFWFAH